MGLITIIFLHLRRIVRLDGYFDWYCYRGGKLQILNLVNSPGLGKAMTVDAIGVSAGALLGTSTITAFAESAAGVGAGGRQV